jgi:hypothetical protein
MYCTPKNKPQMTQIGADFLLINVNLGHLRINYRRRPLLFNSRL